MGLLPAISMILLAAFAVWFFWPKVADPIARATNPSRRALRNDPDSAADHLFQAWAERT